MSAKNTYPATLLCDFYKISHREQYPENTQYVYSTWIPRMSRIEGVDKVVAFGFQSFIMEYLIDYFNENFFSRPVEDVVAEYSRVIKFTLGVNEVDVQHIADLHALGFLPLEIWALPEGTLVPLRVPMLSVENTDPKFFWLTNYIETLMSNSLWVSSTSATIAYQYRKILDKYAMMTVGNTDFVPFQGHDFSMRGLGSLESALMSGAAHLTSFYGTDTIPAILRLEKYYGANIETEMVGTSIPATEHSVMCAYGENEFEAYKRIITEVYPSGFVSIVSDTWDLWKVLSDVIAELKDEIMARDGKVVIRPDSGDPVKIVCGDPDGKTEAERKGVVEVLWDIFGGTISETGYRILDSHIGCIYGDAITLERAEAISRGLAEKGFASINTVYGIGSFTYQYNTRDTFGFALKSTHVIIDNEDIQIYKDPKTDTSGVKKSLKGRVVVVSNGATELIALDGLSMEDQSLYEEKDHMKQIFHNGKLTTTVTLAEVRERLSSY